MRDHSKHIELNREEAIRRLLETCQFKPETEVVSIRDAIGRVLAEDAFSLIDMPNCLNCRMDSVAVHFDDFEKGIPDTSTWVRGKDWEFANTGIGMPVGFDTAITVEHCTFSENDTKVSFDAAPSERYGGTSPAGSRLKKGELLVSAGTKITPLLAAHILSGNNTEVRVIRKPRVIFIPTGNELVPAPGPDASPAPHISGDMVEGHPVARGCNIETNSVMICGKIRQWGGEPVANEIIRDDPQSIEDTLRQAASTADIIVLNAGTSKGHDDWSIEVVEKIGEVIYHQTNHGPGHHSWCGLVDGTPVIGISGPPGGASFTSDFYLYPAIMKFLGLTERLPKIRVRLAVDLPAKRTAGKGEKVSGEATPPKFGEFYSVKLFKLILAEDGVLEAHTFESRHWPAPPMAETGAAYYLMLSGNEYEPPKKGDWIEVELRPELAF